jgi:hypothetical protein
MTSGNSDE